MLSAYWASRFIPIAAVGILLTPALAQPIDPNRLTPELRDALTSRGLAGLAPLRADPNDPTSVRSQFQTRIVGEEPTGILIVQLTEPSQAKYEQLKTLLEGLGAVVGPYAPSIGRFEAEGRTVSLALRLAGDPDVEIVAERRPLRTQQLAPNVLDAITPFNIDAQRTHRVQVLRTTHNLSGAGVQIGVWDEARVVTQHQEFGSRVVQGDTPAGFSRHATHVTGTIGAAGRDPLAQGMAPAATVRTFDWTGDLAEMDALQVAGSVVSNHSYGLLTGWDWDEHLGWRWWGNLAHSRTEDSRFGKYDSEAAGYDAFAFTHPEWSIFKAAGNERGRSVNDPTSDPSFDGRHLVRLNGTWVQSSERRLPDMFDRGGYDTLEGASVSKNALVIGAIHDITSGAAAPTDIRVTDFTSWGCTDDGRIKPDLVANGAGLFSPTYQSSISGQPNLKAYERMNGTSMATPASAGIGALLVELASRTQRVIRSDELKALLIHTAQRPEASPSCRTGWGMIRADLAGSFLASNGSNLRRGSVQNAPVTISGTAVAGRAIRITLVWTDPPGKANTGGLDDRTRALVNDIDLVVSDAGGRVRFPWSIDVTNYEAPARNDRANQVDNVEVVDLAGPEVPAGTGTWRIEVRPPAGLTKPQTFALAITGLELSN